MAGESRVLYIGITNDIRRRVWEHKSNINPAASRSCLWGAGARVPLGRILQSFAPPGKRGRLPLRDSPVFAACILREFQVRWQRYREREKLL
jgi:hypothetical protein